MVCELYRRNQDAKYFKVTLEKAFFYIDHEVEKKFNIERAKKGYCNFI